MNQSLIFNIKRKEVIFTAYIKKTDNPKMGRPSENLTHDIKVRIDDELNSQIEKYAVKCTLSKAAAIREILSSFFAQN